MISDLWPDVTQRSGIGFLICLFNVFYCFFLGEPSPCGKTGLAPRRQCTFSSFLLFLLFSFVFYFGGVAKLNLEVGLAGFNFKTQNQQIQKWKSKKKLCCYCCYATHSRFRQGYPTFWHGRRSYNSNNSDQDTTSKKCSWHIIFIFWLVPTLPKSRIPHSKLQTPKSKLRKQKIPNPNSKIKTPKSKIQNPKLKLQSPRSRIPNPKSKMRGSKRSKIICRKGMKSPVYDFRPLVGAYPKVSPFKTLSSWNPACSWPWYETHAFLFWNVFAGGSGGC